MQGTLAEIEEVYSHDDAMKLYAMAVLRVCNPDVKDCELQEKYQDSFLSEFHPGIPLSRNTVSKFLSDIGKQLPMIYAFMRKRAEKVGIDHHLLIDGTLKSNDSTINTLSDYSYKSRLRNRNDISVLYAFNLEKGAGLLALLSRRHAGCHGILRFHQQMRDFRRNHRGRQGLPGIRHRGPPKGKRQPPLPFPAEEKFPHDQRPCHAFFRRRSRGQKGEHPV